MFDVRLFPPQVLSDLNFFHVKSERELAFRLRTLQRVVAAAIGAYLMERYMPILAAKLGSSYEAYAEAHFTFVAGYGCLSFPIVGLIWSGRVGYLFTRNAVLTVRNIEIGRAVINVVGVSAAYFFSQIYRCSGLEDQDPYLEAGPNFLERFFQKVEDKLTKPLWVHVYKK